MTPFPSPSISRGRFVFFLVSLFFALASANGCSWLISPPQSDPEAAEQLARWSGHNLELKQFKGLYRVRVETAQQPLSIRAALAAIVPHRLRVELLNLLGQPLMRLVSDGKFIEVLSVADQKFYRFKQTGDALEPFIHVPLGIEALLDTLCGRPPLPEYAAARMEAGQPSRTVIVLVDRWQNRVADLWLGADGRMQTLQRYANDGTLAYEIQWLDWHPFQGYLLPGQIKVAAGSGERVTWSTERLWTNVTLPPDTFILEPPRTP